MDGLALIYLDQCRWKEAEWLLSPILEIRKRDLKKSPTILASESALAIAYKNQGRLKEAENLEFEALKGTRMIYGENHRQTFGCMSNLAATYFNQGRFNEAETLLEKALEIGQKAFGKYHPGCLEPKPR
ncbi:unnamed protein product [Clonostachys rosea f. rosea IK726]|uniref:Uncharacterized protein n=1 Tax=Clonostachys rosea f. rosea IK726 TaxID=1349383 RepID=A0ACA9TPH7_BIOOC|nr:unnamed protein product [Clonostachys rosea f. rosea IK726]